MSVCRPNGATVRLILQFTADTFRSTLYCTYFVVIELAALGVPWFLIYNSPYFKLWGKHRNNAQIVGMDMDAVMVNKWNTECWSVGRDTTD